MILALIGESCTGKTDIAALLKQRYGAEVFTDRDYLKLAKKPEDAEDALASYLAEHQTDEKLIVFVISEEDELRYLPEVCRKVLCVSSLERIKDRYVRRMRGQLNAPIAAMLEKKHGMFDQGDYLETLDTSKQTPEENCDKLAALLL